jgi:hypothetical protein
MAVDVLSEVIIDRPTHEVAEYAANPDHAPEWYVNIEAVEWKTERPLRTGSQVAFVAHFLGRRLAYTYQVAEWQPDERLVMRTSQGPFPMETTYTWEPMPEGRTRMTLRNRGTPLGFAKLAAPLIAGAMQRANRKDLAALKRVMETQGTS